MIRPFLTLPVGLFLLLSVLAVGSGCNRAAPAAAVKTVPKVTVSAVVSLETTDADEYTGHTEASETVEIRARVFGYLKSIEFKDGDYVKGPELGPNKEEIEKGQKLFTIEPDEYLAIHQQSLSRIDVNAANLELAKAKHARNEVLVKTGAVSREDFEETRAATKTSEAAITAARADANRTAVDLKYTVLTAPISGRIDRALVSVGNLLSGGTGSGTLLTKIVNEQPMYVYFDVDERSLLRYMRQRSATRDTAPGSLRELGLKCYLQLADEEDFSHEGTIDFASSEVNTSTGTARIRAEFPNKDRALASGLFVRVKIPVSESYQALMIPERALGTDQSIKYVYVVGADETVKRSDVELGEQRGEMRIITSGLAEGDRVIVNGMQRVKPDDKVESKLVQFDATPRTMRKPAVNALPARSRPVSPPPASSQPRRQER